MKSISNLLEKLNIDDINLSKDYKEEISELKEDIDAIVNKMDLGDFKYKGCSASVIYFGLDSSSRYDWDIRYDMKYLNDHDLRFDSIASYGAFEMDDDIFKFYKSVGVILSQEKELDKIKEKFAEIQKVLEKHYEEARRRNK